MKRLHITLLLTLLMSMIGATAFAYDAMIDGIYYNFSGTEATVTFMDGNGNNRNAYEGEIVIPDSVVYYGATYSVTSIGHHAFNSCSGLTSTTIPNSVTSIGGSAFSGCSGLSSITIPNNVTSIEYDAFSGCSSLTSVTIGSSVTSIGDSAFSGCSSLNSVSIPNSVTSIGLNAFSATGWYNNHADGILYLDNWVIGVKDENLTGKLMIVEGTRGIAAGAFRFCSDLTSVTIPNSITSIGEYAFQGCSGLTSVTIPNSVTSIGFSAFNGCSGLTSVTIGNSVMSIEDRAFEGCSGLTSVTIPNSVTSIGGGAFYNCTGLTSVTIGNSVTSIGGWAFCGCRSLTSVTIPNSVTSIGYAAFGNTGWYNKQPNGILYLDNWLLGYKGEKPTGKLVIAEGTKGIAGYTFGFDLYDSCTGLTSVMIPNSVTSIGDGAFYYCSGLTSVTIPNSVMSIEDRAFEGCSGLTSVTIPNSVTSIGGGAFWGCSGLTTVTIGNSVTSIGWDAFASCTSLTSITIPNSVTSIEEKAFAGCSSLTSVTIGNSLARIEEGTFLHCGSLNSITIPNSVTSIGRSAFEKCTSLTSVTIPCSVKRIGQYAFLKCSGIKYVKVPVTDYSAFCENRILELIYSNIGRPVQLITEDGIEITDYRVPEGATSIGNSAFRNCTGLTSVTIPSSVSSIGNYAFSGCSGIKNVKVPVTDYPSFCDNKIIGLIYSNIGKPVQLISEDGTEITDYWVPEGATSIGNSAFRNCAGLTSITIPDGVTSIGENAFSGCSGITLVKVTVTDNSTFCENKAVGLIYSNIGKTVQLINKEGAEITEFVATEGVASISNSAFRNCAGLTSITIPDGVTSIGENAFSGCRGLTSFTIPNSVTSIRQSTFQNCSSLTSLAIPNSVTSIGQSAFNGCSGLTSVTIPNSVKGIGESAFSGCRSLASVTIPNSVTSIGQNAFAGCSGLTSVTFHCKEIGNWFSNLGSIKNVIIGDEVTRIGDSAFSGCRGMTSITIPNGVTSIGQNAFNGWSDLTSATIGSGVTSIGDNAFSGCGSLETVIAMPMIPPHVEQNTFPDAQNISLYVPMGKKDAYEVAEGWRFFKEINEWVGTIFKAVTPQGIEMQFRVVDENEKTVETYTKTYEVGEDFVPCIDPETEGDLIIPSEIEGYRVVGIGSESFRECMGLTSASLPTGITYIGEGAFRLATSLKAVTIPEGVEEIRAHSFNGCPLTTVVLPSTLKHITGTYVFRNSNAKNETCSFIANMQRPSTLDENSIMSMEYYDLYVPKGRKEFYLSEPQWDKFRNIYEMGEVDEDVKDIVTASNVTMKAGENTTLTVSLNTIGNADYNGYQFNLYLPEGISVATDENGNYLVTEKTGRKKVALPLDDGSMLFYTTADKNHAALASGTLMEIELTADSALAAGKYTVRIDRVVCATRDNESVSLPSSTATVTVEKAETDTQGVISADDVEGEPATQIKLPVFLNNATDINAFYFDLTLPMGVTVAKDKAGQFIASFVGEYADGKMLLSCLPWDPSMGTTNNVNTWRFIATPIDDNVFRANAGRVMNITLDVDKDMAGGVYTARMNVVKLVEVVSNGSRSFGMMHAPANNGSWTSYSTITIRTNQHGDVNGDVSIDVADIATVIDVMAGGSGITNPLQQAADVNHDGTVDVADIAAIIDVMAANARRLKME